MTTKHLDFFQSSLSFSMDDFQVRGCELIEEGENVLVCAPTGAGKTIVGEFAVSLALAQGTKCFYTTPIKALSNQKYHDLVADHGAENIGLLTGDVSINHDADVLVMTTEVLRNMIYVQSETLTRLSHVVMDEIHFLSDKTRGAVWEEAILGLDQDVCLIGLSATVSNSEEFGRWLHSVRGSTSVIVSEHRPVPLKQWMLVDKRLHQLFDDDGVSVNERLQRHVAKLEEKGFSANSHAKAGGFRSRSAHTNGIEKFSAHAQRKNHHAFQPLSRPDVLKILNEQNMLPAITFIFSRSGCDSALYQCLRARFSLTTTEQAQEIARIVDRAVADIPKEDLRVLDFSRWKTALQRGFATHHAGMLPAFRHVVEELFSKGLVRAVFATETLALGVNMPARTVVLEKLVKFNGESHVELSPGQYTQLVGRAGRRGIDTIGHAVVMWAPALDPKTVTELASTRTYPLNSTFAPGYNMAVNLLGTIGFEPAHRLLEKSFAQYQADGSVVSEVREREQAEQNEKEWAEKLHKLIQSMAPPSEHPEQELLEYIQLRRTLKDAEKQAKKQAGIEREKEVIRSLSRLKLGQVIALPTKKRPVLAVVVQPAKDNHDPHPWVTMESGWSGKISADSLRMPPIIVGTMSLPRLAIARPRKGAASVVRAFARHHFDRPKKMKLEAKARSNRRVLALRTQLRQSPVHYWADLEAAVLLGEKLLKARRTVAYLSEKISSAKDTLGHTFDRIIELLAELDYVEFVEDSSSGTRLPQITDEGTRLAHIHTESDLLVAQCLKRGIWNELDPAELAGVASMCCFENRKETRGQHRQTVQAASEAMENAMNNTIRLWDALSTDERRYRLPITRFPDAGFALAIHQWTAGAPLDYCLAAAAESGAELSPGDFVRYARQVVDLLEQIRTTAYTDEMRYSARQAADAIRRGVVAIGD
ncbi:RNA helicase [Corynebacterium sp. sy039]|uniref:DEAD/DEAH box helicase n=1 Tax=Corynebacterium sp. sy039 TaxID=2599641 RepID=UPI0011B7098C|nr:DEAD/DEAH box helicase [Corynebacterium sp. sy039]QDZ42598.1 DEAD/DEAH box helicase [Corynebacterium sp. sy039]